MELRHLGAPTALDVAGGSAIGGRASAFTFTMIGVSDPSLFDVIIPAFADELAASIRPWVSVETTINFAGDTSTTEAFAAAWPEAPIADYKLRGHCTTRLDSLPTVRPVINSTV